MDLLEFLDVAIAKQLEYIVLINDRTHYIFSHKDVISEGWAMLYKVKEVVSENYNSVIVRIEYIDEE